MPTATMTSKGRITIPSDVRQAMGLRAGTKVDFVPAGDGFKVVALRTEASSLKGRFAGRTARPVSIEEMDRAISSVTSARVRWSMPRAGRR